MQPTFTETDFRSAVAQSSSIRQVAIALGLCPQGGGTYTTIHRYIKIYDLNTSHFTGMGHLKNKTHTYQTKPLDIFLNLNRTSSDIKKRLWKEGILRQECYECGLPSSWNNKPLSLQLDHINGNHKDNRIENLRILCPNCHSQTVTFCSRNRPDQKPKKVKAIKPKPSLQCLDCEKPITRDGLRCPSCAQKNRHKVMPQSTKIIWPDQVTLQAMIDQSSYTETARILGVSDGAVRKHLKNHSLT